MKIYISGPIKNDPKAREKFAQAEMMVQSCGHEAVNPFKVAPNPLTYQWALKMDIAALLDCDAILLLDDWQNSYGAKIEQQVAEGIGLFQLNLEGVIALSKA